MDEIAEALARRLSRRSSAPVVVAFSGGGDSLALLLAAKTWADGAGRPTLALTVDHCLQPASADWARWCAARAGRLGAVHRILAWTTGEPTSGVPARARRARHALLARAARAAGASVVLMGHTLDDRLEARLMRAAGGSVGEPREWAPSPVWPDGRGVFLLRPMLNLRREALRQWLRSLGETWIDDPANADPASPRARARALLQTTPEPPSPSPEVLPPNEGERTDRLASSSERGPPAKRVEGAGRGDLLLRTSVEPNGEVEINLEGLTGADSRRLLGAALVCAGGGERPPRAAALDRLMARLGKGDGAATLAGARARWRGERVHLAREADPRRRPTGAAAAETTLRTEVGQRLAAALGAVDDEAAAEAWRLDARHTKSKTSREVRARP